MKKILLAAFAAFLIFTTGCTKKENDTGINSAETKTQETAKSYVSITKPAKPGRGEQAQGSSDFFTGKATVQNIASAAYPSRNTVAYVTFEAGARSNWHTHPAGQTLVVTEGSAWTQEWNGAAYEATAGDVIYCPPDVKHWHGASPYAPMTHVSIVESIDGKNVNWMEPVTEEQYKAAGDMISKYSGEEKMNGTLSQKQRQIAAIAAFTASGNENGLKTELNEGLDAGLTVNEIKEIIVQLYAYAGFPRSLNALNVFMSVLKARGGKDSLGEEGKPLAADADKRKYGTQVQTELVGMPVKGELMYFAPAIDIFLKEHLFADIFGRGVLSFQDREIATIAALSNMHGVGSQLDSHVRIGMNVGLTQEQIQDTIAVVDSKVNKTTGKKRPETF